MLYYDTTDRRQPTQASEDQVHIIVSALYTAASEYERCAGVANTDLTMPHEARIRMVNQFAQQANEARALAELLE